jgi:hypothetical protein
MPRIVHTFTDGNKVRYRIVAIGVDADVDADGDVTHVLERVGKDGMDADSWAAVSLTGPSAALVDELAELVKTRRA